MPFIEELAAGLTRGVLKAIDEHMREARIAVEEATTDADRERTARQRFWLERVLRAEGNLRPVNQPPPVPPGNGVGVAPPA